MSKIKNEIVRLIEKLHNHNVYPSIHGTELILFGDQSDELMRFIQDFSIIKDPRYIRQILLWKLNMVIPERQPERSQHKGRPLSSLDREDAGVLYNCIFDQKMFLKKLSSPLNIVLFRRGTSGQHLTNILKTLPNVNTTILVSGTDDSKSWFHGATVFHAPGLPSAGKAMIALANDRDAKDFLSLRIELEGNQDIHHFHMLVRRLREPGNNQIILVDSTRKIFKAAMKMTHTKRKDIGLYLDAFLKEYENEVLNNGQIFPLSDIPLRSLVILGAYFYKNKNSGSEPKVSWQNVLDELSKDICEISPEGKENKILFLTDERQRLIALDEKGLIYLSEIAIKEYEERGKFLGIWLLNETINEKFVHNFLSGINNSNNETIDIDYAHKFLSSINSSNYETIDIDYVYNLLNRIYSNNIKIHTHVVNPDAFTRYGNQIADTILKIDGQFGDYCNVAKLIDTLSSSGSNIERHVRILEEAQAALENADLILYSDKHIETSVGAALIVPGAKDSIIKNPNNSKIRICLSQRDEDNAYENVDSVYRYVTTRMKYLHPDDINWPNSQIDDYVDYVVLSKHQNIHKSPFKKRFKNIDVFTQYYNSDINPGLGTYPAKALSEIIIGLLGVQKAGFIADQEYGLMQKKYIMPDLNTAGYHKAVMGLFQNDNIKKFVERTRFHYAMVIGNGGFVFDVDMTLMPKKAVFLTDYPTLAYYIMLLLRDDQKVGIISGNSEEEQIPRIIDAIKIEMEDYISSLQNLTFYVNGGATKIEFNAEGKKRPNTPDESFNQDHAMDYTALKKAVDDALIEMNQKYSFNLSENEKQEFMKEAKEKYPELTLVGPWADVENWKPIWISPLKINEKRKNGEEITIPWVEIRGEREKEKKVASIAIKPTPQIGNKDIRGFIQEKIKEKLGVNKSDYFLRSGGSSTTDITREDADKRAALHDFIRSNNLTMKHVYYFGDEFYVRPDTRKGENDQISNDEVDLEKSDLQNKNVQKGNDEVIARESSLKDVNTIAVNCDDFDGADEKTTWIGRSPQAVLEFLEQILLD